MEIGLEDKIKSYAGGLGILAGDTLKTASDIGLQMYGVTLLYKNGYFKQEFSETSEQLEKEDHWDFENLLEKTGVTIDVPLRDANIKVEVLKYELIGKTTVPIYFLNTDIPENEDKYKYISYNLYTPFNETRLLQEIVLGIGGVYALSALGLEIDTYHLNESHAGFGIIALMNLYKDINIVRGKTVFTTHTPAEHGHIIHYRNQLQNYLKEEDIKYLTFEPEGRINMTKFLIDSSKYANAVAKKHGEVSSNMFNKSIPGITNGVHLGTWLTDSTKEMLEKHIPGWRKNLDWLQLANSIPVEEIDNNHKENKKRLISYVNSITNEHLSTDIFTIGFARRVDGYKRSGFLFYRLEELKKIAYKHGGLQVIFSGKAYYDYKDGEDHLAHVIGLSKEDLGKLNVVFVPDYSMNVSKLMISGSDLWLNNPIKPLEASGTSGMKAAINGVPNLSTVDGWWVEGVIEGITGWSIGNEFVNNEEEELNDLYTKLDTKIMNLYYNDYDSYLKIIRSTISYLGNRFNSERMLKEYLYKSYLYKE